MWLSRTAAGWQVRAHFGFRLCNYLLQRDEATGAQLKKRRELELGAWDGHETVSSAVVAQVYLLCMCVFQYFHATSIVYVRRPLQRRQQGHATGDPGTHWAGSSQWPATPGSAAPRQPGCANKQVSGDGVGAVRTLFCIWHPLPFRPLTSRPCKCIAPQDAGHNRAAAPRRTKVFVRGGALALYFW